MEASIALYSLSVFFTSFILAAKFHSHQFHAHTGCLASSLYGKSEVLHFQKENLLLELSLAPSQFGI